MSLNLSGSNEFNTFVFSVCTDCPAGSFTEEPSDTRTCKLCVVGTFGTVVGANNSDAACTACPDDTYSLNTNPAGMYSKDSACQVCPSGTLLSDYAMNVNRTGTLSEMCTPCARDSYGMEVLASNISRHICRQCFSNSGTIDVGSVGIDACICNEGFEPERNFSHRCQAREIIICHPMQIQADIWSPCSWCLPFQAPSSDSTQCEDIASRDYVRVLNFTQCSKHQVTTARLRLNESIPYSIECVNCPAMNDSFPDLLQYAGIDALVSPEQCSMGCRPGTYTYYAENVSSVSDYSCPVCPPGTITATFGEKFCTPCPAGSYAPYNDSSMRCDLSPAGSIQPDIGRFGIGSLRLCEPGSSSDVGQVACTNCSAGTFNTIHGGICIACSIGKYSANSGSSRECDVCALGTTSLVGQSSCSKCPVGTYSRSPFSACVLCIPGTF
jgi:hypothetical protein